MLGLPTGLCGPSRQVVSQGNILVVSQDRFHCTRHMYLCTFDSFVQAGTKIPKKPRITAQTDLHNLCQVDVPIKERPMP